MAKKIIKRTEGGETLYFGTHSDAVQVGEGNAKGSLTEWMASLDSDKADKTQLLSLVDGGSYNSNTKKIELKHGSTVLAQIDATDFIKDGMVSSVEISNGNLVITFNTDSGQEPISIPLTEIFDPSNYYTKNEVKLLLAGKQNLVTDINAIRSGASAGATAYQKPSGGIPASDMAQNVQDAITKAEKIIIAEVSAYNVANSISSAAVQRALYNLRQACGSAKYLVLFPDNSSTGGGYVPAAVISLGSSFVFEFIYYGTYYEVTGNAQDVWSITKEIDLSDFYTKQQMDTALGGKVDKVNGKGLSTNDYTTVEKTKLGNMASEKIADFTVSDLLADPLSSATTTKLQALRNGLQIGEMVLIPMGGGYGYVVATIVNVGSYFDFFFVNKYEVGTTKKYETVYVHGDPYDVYTVTRTPLIQPQDLSDFYTKQQMDTALGGKVDKVKLDISLSVVAESLLYLYSENKALRELLAGKDNAVLPVVKAQSVECDDILTLGVPNVLYSSVEGAPSAANVPDNWDEETMTVWNGCPRKIGQQYVDKVSKKVYYAVAVTGSTNDWVALN